MEEGWKQERRQTQRRRQINWRQTLHAYCPGDVKLSDFQAFSSQKRLQIQSDDSMLPLLSHRVKPAGLRLFPSRPAATCSLRGHGEEDSFHHLTAWRWPTLRKHGGKYLQSLFCISLWHMFLFSYIHILFFFISIREKCYLHPVKKFFCWTSFLYVTLNKLCLGYYCSV